MSGSERILDSSKRFRNSVVQCSDSWDDVSGRLLQKSDVCTLKGWFGVFGGGLVGTSTMYFFFSVDRFGKSSGTGSFGHREPYLLFDYLVMMKFYFRNL